MKEEKTNIRGLSFNDIKEFLVEKGEKPFLAKQVYEWLWKKNVHQFSEMTNLSKTARTLLGKFFIIPAIKIHSLQISKDETIKTSFKLIDNNIVEGVLIPSKNRMTACISSQVGCLLGCQFCATAKLGYKRNLKFDEILDQVSIINKQSLEHHKLPLSHIVYMGMGEPLLNYLDVMKSIEKITSEDGLGMSPRRVTLSTVGIPDKIKKLGDDKIKFNLAISLHTANDLKRTSIMPVNKKYPLLQLVEAIKYFYKKTEGRITYEYILFKDFNDSLNDAKELAEFCKISPCKINLIEYNSTGHSKFLQTSKLKFKAFADFLESKNMIVNIRKSRGFDINAACGQLANKLNKK